MSYLIDSHCHLHDPEFFSTEEAAECLRRARANGVEKIICIGTSHEDSLKACEFASAHENVYWTYGVHPENTRQGLAEPTFAGAELEFLSTSYAGCLREPHLRDEPLGAVRNIRVKNSNQTFMHSEKTGSAAHPVSLRPIAIGEVGLDYHYEGYNREAQIKLFEQMLQLAVDNDLPVSFHIREAFDDFFPVVENFPRVRGVVHSFTDSKKVLKRMLNETEFYIGVNGLATYSTLPLPPLERVLLETDAPFLAPVPHRGDKNEPAFVAEVAKWLAQQFSVTADEVAEVTTHNTAELFRLT